MGNYLDEHSAFKLMRPILEFHYIETRHSILWRTTLDNRLRHPLLLGITSSCIAGMQPCLLQASKPSLVR